VHDFQVSVFTKPFILEFGGGGGLSAGNSSGVADLAANTQYRQDTAVQGRHYMCFRFTHSFTSIRS
jgi:hypothetical protein